MLQIALQLINWRLKSLLSIGIDQFVVILKYWLSKLISVLNDESTPFVPKRRLIQSVFTFVYAEVLK
jgi:hypothetical protein